MKGYTLDENLTLIQGIDREMILTIQRDVSPPRWIE